jgi:hypothetical protein
MAFYGDDGWDYHRGRRPSRYEDFRRSQQYLNPGGSGLHRTRSHGHSPQPVINNIYMEQMDNASLRTESPYRVSPPQPPAPVMPQFAPPVAQPVYMPYPVSPERSGRSRSRIRDEIVEEMAEMNLRGRSRGRTEGSLMDNPNFAEWRLEQKEKELEEEHRRRMWEKEAELRRFEAKEKQLDAERQKQLWERDMELRKMKEDARLTKEQQAREDERKRIISEMEEKKRKEAEHAKAEKARIIAEMEQEKKDQKERERLLLEKIERDKRDAEEREKREYEEFKRKEKAKEEKKKAEEIAEKEKLDAAMRERFRKMGYAENQIEWLMNEEKRKTEGHRGRSPGQDIILVKDTVFKEPRAPVYAKVHTDYLSIETLKYYEIPWEYDRVSLLAPHPVLVLSSPLHPVH